MSDQDLKFLCEALGEPVPLLTIQWTRADAQGPLVPCNCWTSSSDHLVRYADHHLQPVPLPVLLCCCWLENGCKTRWGAERDRECVQLISLFKHMNEGSRRQMAEATNPPLQHTHLHTPSIYDWIIIIIIVMSCFGEFSKELLVLIVLMNIWRTCEETLWPLFVSLRHSGKYL